MGVKRLATLTVALVCGLAGLVVCTPSAHAARNYNSATDVEGIFRCTLKAYRPARTGAGGVSGRGQGLCTVEGQPFSGSEIRLIVQLWSGGSLVHTTKTKPRYAANVSATSTAPRCTNGRYRTRVVGTFAGTTLIIWSPPSTIATCGAS